jgi:hypothetical protein
MTQISGVFPSMAVQSGTAKPRNELAIGALMPWAGKLWTVSYVAHQGQGGCLRSLDLNLNLTVHPESVTGTFANRMMHGPSDSIIIGPYHIDAKGRVSVIQKLTEYRLAGACAHLTDPENKVYVLSMEGPLFEVDLHTLTATEICNLTYELGIFSEKRPGWTGKAKDGHQSPQPHFKAIHSSHGLVYAANNTYDEQDLSSEQRWGRLATWDGNTWTTVSTNAFCEVTGRTNYGEAVLATGWDRASAILMVHAGGKWQQYRLPKGSHTYEHFWATEWPRIREVEHERYLMDASGIFYELSGLVIGGKVWGIKPICSHLRVIPDYCGYAGLLVMGDNQVSPVGNEWCVGESQSNYWFGKLDDLWSFGKPTGWGGPWRKTNVKAGVASDPYLMTGFDKKGLHLTHHCKIPVQFTVEIDFLGDQSWVKYETFTIPPNGYVHHEFPSGFSAHWLRVTADQDCLATAYLMYT